MSSKNRVGLACGLLFTLPFCVAGVAAAVLAVRAWLGHGEEPEARFVLPAIALIFGGVGFGLLTGLLLGHRGERRSLELRERHPDEPWRWNPDWAEGRVRCETKSGAIGLCVFAAFWNLISVPAAVLALREELPKGNRAALIALLFPAVGALLAGWALVALARWRKYGVSVFEMSRLPGVVGGSVEGEVQVGAPVEAQGPIEVVLSCVERKRTGSGKNSGTRETVLWQDELPLPMERVRRSRVATTIPVAFRVPLDCRPSEKISDRHQVLWRLRVAAETPGADYETRFEIPVFRTEGSRPDPPEPAALEPRVPEAPRDPRIRVSTTTTGRLRLHFGAFRNVGVSLGLGVMSLIWWAVVVVVFRSDAPDVFGWVFGFFGLFLAWGFLASTFRSSEVVADRDRLSVRWTWFGLFGPTRSVPASEVEAVRLKRGLQASGGTKQVTYHDLEARLRGGRRLSLGRSIRSRREGEWLVRRLQEVLGLDGGDAPTR